MSDEGTTPVDVTGAKRANKKAAEDVAQTFDAWWGEYTHPVWPHVSGEMRRLAEAAWNAARESSDTPRFPCGHRIDDWDDSYGGCSACSFITAAHEHDKCPIVESSDRSVVAAVREVWPHLTGHCLEGATPACFGTMRNILSAVLPDLPYASPSQDQARSAETKDPSGPIVTVDSQVDLLPCPFCGGEAEQYEYLGPVMLEQITGCKECGAKIEHEHERARTSWNRRANVPEPAAEEK